MKLLKLELKRVLKTRLTWILLLCSLALTLFMAYMPTTFVQVEREDETGALVTLQGLEAIRYQKALQQDISGVVTPQKLSQALADYQACLNRYGAKELYDLPDGVFSREILPFYPMLHGIREANADPNTGMAPSLMDLEPQDLAEFYPQVTTHLGDLMKMEQKEHPAAQAKAQAVFAQVDTPYEFYPGYNKDAMDYQVLLGFLVALFCTVIAAPVFASEYQTGSDDILRCTKHGRIQLAGVKILSVVLICGLAFALCGGLYILLSNSLFGWECTKTSVQMLYSIVNLPNLNLGQLQWTVLGGSLLSLLAMVSFTLFLSSKLPSVVSAVTVSLVFSILPVVLYLALPGDIGNWIYPILPAGGVCMQASYLFALIDFDFWNLGSLAIWLPQVMAAAHAVEIPVFLGLTAWTYCRHKGK